MSRPEDAGDATRWLITGGCGFIGRNLILALQRAEPLCRVRVLDDLSVGTERGLAAVTPYATVAAEECARETSSVQLVVGSVTDLDSARACARGVDVVVHLAAHTGVVPSVEDPFEDARVNVTGTLNLLEGARQARARAFVFASSGAPLGTQIPPLHEEMAPRPASPYGASKLAGEGYCSAFFHSYGLPAVVLRFSNVYGPLSSMKESVVARFIRRAIAREPLVIYGDGSQTRDYIFVEDLVQCIVSAARSSAGGQVLQVATGVETPLNELVGTMRTLLEPRIGAMVVEHAPARAGEVARSCADISKVRRLVGWSPRWSLADGLAQTVSWFLEQSDVKPA